MVGPETVVRRVGRVGRRIPGRGGERCDDVGCDGWLGPFQRSALRHGCPVSAGLAGLHPAVRVSGAATVGSLLSAVGTETWVARAGRVGFAGHPAGTPCRV